MKEAGSRFCRSLRTRVVCVARVSHSRSLPLQTERKLYSDGGGGEGEGQQPARLGECETQVKEHTTKQRREGREIDDVW